MGEEYDIWCGGMAFPCHGGGQIGNILHVKIKQGVCYTMALPFTLKSILRQKKNDGNSNISPCKNIPNLPKIL